MNRLYFTAIVLGFCALSLGAQGKGKAVGQSPAQTKESNAPARTPHGTVDRDFGRDRAEEVGQGKKTGLEKQDKVKQSGRKGKKVR
jgi:hypothetical protein